MSFICQLPALPQGFRLRLLLFRAFGQVFFVQPQKSFSSNHKSLFRPTTKDLFCWPSLFFVQPQKTCCILCGVLHATDLPKSRKFNNCRFVVVKSHGSFGVKLLCYSVRYLWRLIGWIARLLWSCNRRRRSKHGPDFCVEELNCLVECVDDIILLRQC